MAVNKRAYFVGVSGDDTGIGVIATSSREAKIIGFAYLTVELCCSELDWTDLRVNWKRNVTGDSIKDIPVGAVADDLLGLKIGLYGGLYEVDCPICGETRYVTIDGDKIGCEKCLYDEE